MSNFVESLKKGQNLSFEESKALFNELMEGKYDESSIIEILETLLKKGETKVKKKTGEQIAFVIFFIIIIGLIIYSINDLLF